MIWINQILQGILLGGYYALIACGLSFLFSVMHHQPRAWQSRRDGGLRAVLARRQFWSFALSRTDHRAPRDGGDWLGAEKDRHRAKFACGAAGARALDLRPFDRHRQSAVPGLWRRHAVAGAVCRLASYDSFDLSDDISLGSLAILTFVVAVAMLGGLQWLLSRTTLGRAIRATAEDADTVGLLGVNAQRVNAIAMAIAMVTVGVAGASWRCVRRSRPMRGRPNCCSPSRRR